MNFKNIIAGAFCLCLASVVACNKEQGDEVPSREGFVSLTVNSAAAVSSKTWMDANSSESVLPVYWSNGDQIAVNGIASNALEVGAGEKLSSAVFKVRNVSAPFRVLYPASFLKSVSETYEMTVTLPDTQSYVENSFGNGSAVLCAYSESEEGPVALKNCCGAICVTLKDEGNTGISALTLTSLGGNPISGDFILDVENAKLNPVSGGSVVKMTFADGGIKLSSAGTKFIFTIPAGSYPEGFSLKFLDENKHVLRCFWLRKSVNAEKGVEVNSGSIVFFEAKEYDPDAREITCAEDWEAFATAYNSGVWEDEWLGKDGTIKITSDFSAEKLTPVANFSSVLEGGNHTITQTAANMPLFSSLSGTVRNLTLAGKMSPADPGVAGAVMFATTLTKGGLIENCTNKADVVLSTSSKTVVSAFVRTMDGGTIRNCVNDGVINVVVNVNDADQPVVVGGFAATVSLNSSALISSCTNNKNITVTIDKAASSARRPVQAGYGGIVGTYVKGDAGKYLTVEKCVNNGNVNVAYSAAPTSTSALLSGVGGILGAAMTFNSTGSSSWYSSSSRPSSVDSEDCVYMIMDKCINNGDIHNDLVSNCSSDDMFKCFSGGLAGILNGIAANHIEVKDCETYGKVTPHENKYSRSSLGCACGGFTGFGAYVDFSGCTLKSSQIGTIKRQNYSVAGAIGYVIATFKIVNCKIFADFKHIRTTDYSEDNYALCFNLSTKANTKGGVWPQLIKIDGSEVSGNKLGGTFAYNSLAVAYNAATPSADKTETVTASTVEARVASKSFYSNSSYTDKVTMSNNTYWDGK